jgi:hypothetical protein
MSVHVMWQLAPLEGRLRPYTLVHRAYGAAAWGKDKTACGLLLPPLGQLMNYAEGDSTRSADHCLKCFPEMKLIFSLL